MLPAMARERLRDILSGRNWLTRMMGKTVGGSASAMQGYLRMIETGRGLDRLGDVPPLREWLPYYRCHRRLTRELEGAVEGGDGRRFESLADGCRAMSRLPREEIAQVVRTAMADEEAVAAAREMMKRLQRQEAEIDAELQGREGLPCYPAAVYRQPAVAFFARVWLPCLLLHRDYPTRLYRRARLGDINALVDLIRLDKSVLGDLRIMEQVHRAGHSSRRALARKLARAMGEWPKALSRKRLKYRLGSLIKAGSDTTGDVLTNPALQRVFDGLTQVMTRGKDRIDTDLPQDPETFARRMRAEKGLWGAVIHPDKSRS